MSNALALSPADVTRWLIIQLGVGTDPSLNLAWPVYCDNEPDLPDNCITVYNTSGIVEGRDMNSGEAQEQPGAQFRIRATDPRTGYAKIDAIKQAIDTQVSYVTVVIGTASYLVHALSRTSGILALGKEIGASRRSVYTLNAVVALRQTV